jgi:hypothetical protein
MYSILILSNSYLKKKEYTDNVGLRLRMDIMLTRTRMLVSSMSIFKIVIYVYKPSIYCI